MFLGMLCFLFLSEPMLRFFSSNENVIEIGNTAFHIIGWSFIPLVTSLTYPVLFQAVGQSVKSTLLTVIRTICLFVPLGYLLYHRLNRGGLKTVLVLLPFVLSTTIEVSQFYFGMGYPDIDDVILNVIGFYIGVLLKLLFDKVFTLRR